MLSSIADLMCEDQKLLDAQDRVEAIEGISVDGEHEAERGQAGGRVLQRVFL